MSDVLTVKLPDSTETPQIGRAFAVPSSVHPVSRFCCRTAIAETAKILASLPRSTPLHAFATYLPSLWSLWECLILAEPVLIIAPDPRICSETVWWLRDLLRPVSFCFHGCESRIHDCRFRQQGISDRIFISTIMILPYSLTRISLKPELLWVSP